MSDPRPDKPVEPTPLEHTPDRPVDRGDPRRRGVRHVPARARRHQHRAVRRRLRRGHGSRQQGRRLPRRLARRRPHRHRRRLRVRPDLGRPLQPRRHPRPRRRRPVPVEGRRRPTSSPRSSAAPSPRRSSCSSACSGPTAGSATPRTAASPATAGTSSRPAASASARAIIVEVLFTALFVIVILGVTHSTRGNRRSPASRSASRWRSSTSRSIPIDNTSVNPARSIATAIYGGGARARPAVGVHRVPDRRRPDRRLRLPRAVRRHAEGLTRAT